jgi:hypothetical protein
VSRTYVIERRQTPVASGEAGKLSVLVANTIKVIEARRTSLENRLLVCHHDPPRAELTEDETSMTVANDLAVRRALEAAGVIFIDENGDAGPGVRLRKRHA